MKAQLEQVIYHKKKTISSLKKIRNKYIACVYEDLLKNKSTREIHRDIKKITLVAKKSGYIVPKELYTYALALGKNISLEINGPLVMPIEQWLVQKFSRLKVYQNTNTLIYEHAKRIENKEKQEVIQNELKQNRALDTPKIFYLASEHGDCAEDHKDYQGKIYVDANWRKYVKNSDIENYITANDIKTLQWVVNKPVWFITRPNCRHYFKAIDSLEVLSTSVKTLVAKYDMHSNIGHKITQTIRHPVYKSWYTTENIENIIEKYEDRLAYHKALLEVQKNPLIENSVKKDEFMIKKWKNML